MEDVENFGVAGVEWFIRLVTNRDGDIRARFDRYRPERYGTEMDVVLYREPPQQLQQYVKAKVDKHVTIQPTIVHRGISFGVSTRKDTAR
jgi:hypothetical protein